MGDEWFGVGKKDGASIKDVVMQHIKGISELSRKEFTPSYWQKKPLKVGDGIAMAETYHEDKRLAYINAIDFLLDLLMPHSDDIFKEIIGELNKEEDRRLEEHTKEKKTEDEWIWIKLELRRTLFGQIMLMITRIKFFEYLPFIDYGAEDNEEEEEGYYE